MTAPKTRPGWFEPEQRIIARYTDAVAKGRHKKLLDAARACMAEIEQLHRDWRLHHPKEARAIVPRTFQTIYTILRKDSQALGRPRTAVDYSPAETALMRRCAEGVVEGRYKTVADATRTVWPEFERLWAKAPDAIRASLPRSVEGVSQRICILTRRLHQPRPVSTWFPAEDKVMRDFARRVIAGHYHSGLAAVPDCRAELARLYARLRRSGRLKLAESAVRTPGAVHIRLVMHLQQLGRRGVKRIAWTVAERRLVAKWARRHDRTVKAGTPWMVSDTIAMLQTELRQQGMKARPDNSCRSALGKLTSLRAAPAARTCGRAPHSSPVDNKTITALSRFRDAQQPLLQKHAEALLDDPSHDIAAATRRCRADMEELRERATRDHPGIEFKLRWQTYKTVHTVLRRLAYKLGMPKVMQRWSESTDRIVRTYARAFLESRYPRITAAGAACKAELARLRKTAPARYKGSERHKLKDICARIDRCVLTYGLPHPAGEFVPSEMLIIDRYARAVAEGRYKAPLPAAGPCFRDLKKLWQRLARRIKPPLRGYSGRTFDAIHARLGVRARDFGYRGAPRRRWLPAERRIAAKWLRRHIIYQNSDTPWSTGDTAQSLQNDLAAAGHVRTLGACRDELLLEIHGRIPAAKFQD